MFEYTFRQVTAMAMAMMEKGEKNWDNELNTPERTEKWMHWIQIDFQSDRFLMNQPWKRRANTMRKCSAACVCIWKWVLSCTHSSSASGVQHTVHRRHRPVLGRVDLLVIYLWVNIGKQWLFGSMRKSMRCRCSLFFRYCCGCRCCTPISFLIQSLFLLFVELVFRYFLVIIRWLFPWDVKSERENVLIS